jgi:PIN domain nuclease of toxin-antitoxin system
VQLLLDTHAFLWWIIGSQHLSRRIRAAIADEENDIFVSAASAWEITTKFRLGKLPDGEAVAGNVASSIASQGFSELAITVRHGQLAGSLPRPHRDPFDRMLIAQSIVERMPLVSNERIFDSFGVQRLW